MKGDGRTGAYLSRFAEAVTFLVKAPRTAADLKEAMGITSGAQAYAYLHALHAEGLVRIAGYRRYEGQRGAGAAVYEWQPGVFARSDASRDEVEVLVL